ncbi:MAG: hypothetical protein KDD51_15275, partial [Bdellovibrionales bacterium]|nr:hypothetical protein [Bdellovibrionales bacterium]
IFRDVEKRWSALNPLAAELGQIYHVRGACPFVFLAQVVFPPRPMLVKTSWESKEFLRKIHILMVRRVHAGAGQLGLGRGGSPKAEEC